ncbi:hypothetical protein [Citrobacter sp. JGM124]|nr:hypothetical protein [Citrobacter sp. JGM124]
MAEIDNTQRIHPPLEGKMPAEVQQAFEDKRVSGWQETLASFT